MVIKIGPHAYSRPEGTSLALREHVEPEVLGCTEQQKVSGAIGCCDSLSANIEGAPGHPLDPDLLKQQS